MNYKKIMGYSNKKVVKNPPKNEKNKVLETIKKDLGYINEWYHQPPTEKRWSGAYGRKDGLTEFEAQGGKDTINETVPMGKMDKAKFIRFFDMALKTAGSNKAEIYKTLKRMMPSLDNRVVMYMAQGIEDAVKQMTGEE